MPSQYHLMVTATDFLRHQSHFEMVVVAADEEEMHEAIAALFHLRDNIDSWRVMEVLERRPLADSAPEAIHYRESGPFSFFSQSSE